MLGDGSPARFWAYNDDAAFAKVDPAKRPPLTPAPWPPDSERNARFLAKRGINMVRCFINVTPKGGAIDAIDEDQRDVAWRMVAAMKKQGIYTLLTPYWAGASHVKPGAGGSANNSVPGKPKSSAWGLLYIDPILRAAYKSWMKALLSAENPYTKLPLAQDPAVAVIQIQNADGLLWWTVDGALKGEAGHEASLQFGAWLAKTHGSFAGAIARWKGAASPGDDLAASAPAFEGLWQMALPTTDAGKEARRCDQAAFLTELMRSFNTDIADYLTRDLGCKQLINAGNWKTAMAGALGDAQRYADAACQVMAVNRYYGLPTKSKYNGWALVQGDLFEDHSVLKRPLDFPLTLTQVEGHPMIITETLWDPPLSYRSESPLLVAAYSSLTGFDCAFWFANRGEEAWRQPQSANGYIPSLGIYDASTPMSLGQWPAAALLFRKHYLRQGAPVVQEHRPVADVEGMLKPPMVEHEGYRPHARQGDLRHGRAGAASQIDEHAYLVGPVTESFGGAAATTTIAPDLDRCIDAAKGEARSNTGELCWNWTDGVCTVDAPKAQGACGFLGGRGAIALKDVTITCKNRYASIVAVPLDDQPLATSSKVLVQIGTMEEPTGWKTEPATLKDQPAFKVVSIGTAPWQVVEADATIAIANPALAKVRTLDANFEQTAVADLDRAGGKAACPLPKDALYVLLTAQ